MSFSKFAPLTSTTLLKVFRMDSMQKFQIDENYPQFYTKTAMDTEFLDKSIRKKICKLKKNLHCGYSQRNLNIWLCGETVSENVVQCQNWHLPKRNRWGVQGYKWISPPYIIWQYRLWSFQGRNTKLVRFLAKNQL